jgi:hypothetical protein
MPRFVIPGREGTQLDHGEKSNVGRRDSSVSLASNDRATSQIALDVLRVGRGGRLSTTHEYQELLGVGSGTIQKALRQLSSSGAVELRARGHQGTFVTRLDPGRLWHAARIESARVLVTPPGAVEGHGLMQGLKSEFGRIGIPIEFEFVRGGSDRLRRVQAVEADVAVLSEGAALAEISAAPEAYSTLSLGTHSYYGSDSIVILSSPHPPTSSAKTGTKLRVGVDSTSYDHQQLTFAEFPPGPSVEHIECAFTTMPASILEGRVDVGIWHRVAVLVPLHLTGLVLGSTLKVETRRVLSRISAAELIWSKTRPEMGTVLAALNLSAVRNAQQRLAALPFDSEELREQLWLV